MQPLYQVSDIVMVTRRIFMLTLLIISRMKELYANILIFYY